MTELGETRKAQKAFRQISRPTLSLMCFTKLTILRQTSRSIIQNDLKLHSRLSWGKPGKQVKAFRHISCPTWSITKPNDHSAQDHCLRIWEGGNPEWIMSRHLVDEIHVPTSSMPRLCFMLAILTLTQIVHLRRGRPVEDSQSGPLDDDRFFCLLAISMCSLVV